MSALLGGSHHAIELCRVAPDVTGDPAKIGLFGALAGDAIGGVAGLSAW